MCPPWNHKFFLMAVPSVCQSVWMSYFPFLVSSWHLRLLIGVWMCVNMSGRKKLVRLYTNTDHLPYSFSNYTTLAWLIYDSHLCATSCSEQAHYSIFFSLCEDSMSAPLLLEDRFSSWIVELVVQKGKCKKIPFNLFETVNSDFGL